MTSPAEAALREYADAFARGDLSAVVACIHAPCMYIRPGGVVVFPDQDVASEALSVGMEKMQARGYHHTEFIGLTSRALSSELASVSGTLVHVDARGRGINREAFTYTFRLDMGRWRLVCAILHAPLGD